MWNIWFYKKEAHDPNYLRAQLDVGLRGIRHRGPDGIGKWTSENNKVGFGHVRLSVIDLETGSPPADA